MADPTLDPLSTFHQGMQARTNDAMAAQLQALQMRMQMNSGLGFNMPQIDLGRTMRGVFGGYGFPMSAGQFVGQTISTTIQYDAALRQMRGLMGGRFGEGAEALGGFAVRGSAFGNEAAAADKFSESLRRLGMSRYDAVNTLNALSMAARQVTRDMGDAVVKISELSKVAGIDPTMGASLVGNAMRTTGATLNAQTGQAFFSTMMANAGYSTVNVLPTQMAVRGMADMRTMRGAINTMIDPATGLTAADALYRQFARFNPQLYGPGGNPEAAVRQMGMMAAGGKGAFLGIAMDLMPNRSISQVFAALDRGELTFPLRNAIARDPALRDLAALSGLDANFIEGFGTGGQRRSEDDTRRRMMLIAQQGYEGNLVSDLASQDQAVRRRAQDRMKRVRRDEFLVGTTSDPYQDQAAIYYQSRTGRTDFEAALARDDRTAQQSYAQAVNESKRRASNPSAQDIQDATSPAIQALKDYERGLETQAPVAADKLPSYLRTLTNPVMPTGFPTEDQGSWNPFSDKPFYLNPWPEGDRGPFDALGMPPGYYDGPPGSGGTTKGPGASGGAPGLPGAPGVSSGGPGGYPGQAPGQAPSNGPGDVRSNPFKAAGIVVMGAQAVNGVRVGRREVMRRLGTEGLEELVERDPLGLRRAALNAAERRTANYVAERGGKVTARLLWQSARKRMTWWAATKMTARAATAGFITGTTGWTGVTNLVSAALIASDVVTIGMIINDARKAAAQEGQQEAPEGMQEGVPADSMQTSQSMAPTDTGVTPRPRTTTAPRDVASGALSSFRPDSAAALNLQLGMRPDATTTRAMRPMTPTAPGAGGQGSSTTGGQNGAVSSNGAPEFMSLTAMVAALDRVAQATTNLSDRFERGDIKVTMPSVFGPGFRGGLG